MYETFFSNNLDSRIDNFEDVNYLDAVIIDILSRFISILISSHDCVSKFNSITFSV